MVWDRCFIALLTRFITSPSAHSLVASGPGFAFATSSNFQFRLVYQLLSWAALSKCRIVTSVPLAAQRPAQTLLLRYFIITLYVATHHVRPTRTFRLAKSSTKEGEACVTCRLHSLVLALQDIGRCMVPFTPSSSWCMMR